MLDPKSTGYFKYGPIVQQLEGMPTKEFVNKPVLKLSEFAYTKDLLKEEFAGMLDSGARGRLDLQGFKAAIQRLGMLRGANDRNVRGQTRSP